jgi:hypothetical protein
MMFALHTDLVADVYYCILFVTHPGILLGVFVSVASRFLGPISFTV